MTSFVGTVIVFVLVSGTRLTVTRVCVGIVLPT